MTVSRFLTLSPEAKSKQAAILALADSKEVNNIIIETGSDIILTLAIINTEINAICERPIFKDYWQNIWRQCGVNPRELTEKNHQPILEYLPIPTLSCLELVKAHFMYEAYRKGVISHAQTYLMYAANQGSFFALNAMCINILELLRNSKDSNTLLITNVLTYAQKAADLYWTPGYLLLANVCQELAGIAKVCFPDHGYYSTSYFFKQALDSLKMAQRLEPYSETMMGITYQGKTILEANHHIKSWLQAKVRLQNRSGSLLSTAEINDDKKASFQLEKIKKKYRLDSPAQSEEKKLSLTF